MHETPREGEREEIQMSETVRNHPHLHFARVLRSTMSLWPSRVVRVESILPSRSSQRMNTGMEGIGREKGRDASRNTWKSDASCERNGRDVMVQRLEQKGG